MKYSGIGGQAVMEGVMMKNQNDYAIAVRKPDHEIEICKKEYTGASRGTAAKIPFLRGILSFIDSLVLGVSTLMYSASFFEDEETNEKGKTKRQEAQEKALMTGTMIVAFIIALALFVLLPYYLSNLFLRMHAHDVTVKIAEGLIRLAIFVGYIIVISRMKEIQRVFMYHGAEHKCINCIEHGLDLTVDNVRISSKAHKRCGTSFLVFVVILSIILFIFIRVDSHLMQVAIRFLLVPVIAGVSYELLHAAGKSDNALTNALSRPGLAFQSLTTKEPDDEMIEVAIASVEAVFDWKDFVRQVREEGEDL